MKAAAAAGNFITACRRVNDCTRAGFELIRRLSRNTIWEVSKRIVSYRNHVTAKWRRRLDWIEWS